MHTQKTYFPWLSYRFKEGTKKVREEERKRKHRDEKEIREKDTFDLWTSRKESAKTSQKWHYNVSKVPSLT